MGGKALNKYGVTTERKNTDEFLRIGKEIQLILSLEFPLYSTEIVKCYHTKADHGDLDLLIRIDGNGNVNWREYITHTFKPRAINSNSNVHSFDYKNFQIDFIIIHESKWETSNTYYSYDPLGNIMGKTFHKFGLSYGWDGLFYKFRNFNGRNSQNILISTDPKKIFEFADYNYERFLQGFETLEEILKFAINCKYFDTEIFQMENLKAIDKKRNRKRGSYHIFLKYLKDNNINTKYNFSKNKSDYLLNIEDYFPEAKLMEKLGELEKKDKQNKILSQKFNGDIVMSWLPNLKGKELGNAMDKFKSDLGEEYDEFILNSSYDTIHNRFMSIYNNE